MLVLSAQYPKNSHVVLMISPNEAEQTGDGFMAMIQAIITAPNIEKVSLMYCSSLHRHKKILINSKQQLLTEEEAVQETINDSEKWYSENKNALAILREKKGEQNVKLYTWDYYKGRKNFLVYQNIVSELLASGASITAEQEFNISIVSQKHNSRATHAQIRHNYRWLLKHYAARTQQCLLKTGSGSDAALKKIEDLESAFIQEEAAVRVMMLLDAENQFNGELYRHSLSKFLIDIQNVLGLQQVRPVFFLEESHNNLTAAPFQHANFFHFTENINLELTFRIVNQTNETAGLEYGAGNSDASNASNTMKLSITIDKDAKDAQKTVAQFVTFLLSEQRGLKANEKKQQQMCAIDKEEKTYAPTQN